MENIDDFLIHPNVYYHMVYRVNIRIYWILNE